jgi:chromosome partitioning protein
MADTLITPLNDSFFDLDVLVAMENSDVEPQLSAYANMVWRALAARTKLSGRATDWIIVRNRLEALESNNHRQITLVLDVLQRKLGFRIARGLLERPAYREFFAAGLTVFDFAEGPESSEESGLTNSLARVEVESFIRETGLIESHAEIQSEALDEIEAAHD